MQRQSYMGTTQVILDKSWKQHPTKQKLCSNFTPISKPIRWTQHMRYCWRSKDKLKFFHRPFPSTYQCRSTTKNLFTRCEHRYNLEDLPRWKRLMGRERERGRIRKIFGDGVTWIYIYSHPQTDSFVISQLFKEVRHTGRFKLGSKPTELYTRLSILLLSHFDELNQLVNYNAFCISFCLFTFCAIGYRSALFVRRALLYAGVSC